MKDKKIEKMVEEDLHSSGDHHDFLPGEENFESNKKAIHKNASSRMKRSSTLCTKEKEAIDDDSSNSSSLSESATSTKQVFEFPSF